MYYTSYELPNEWEDSNDESGAIQDSHGIFLGTTSTSWDRKPIFGLLKRIISKTLVRCFTIVPTWPLAYYTHYNINQLTHSTFSLHVTLQTHSIKLESIKFGINLYTLKWKSIHSLGISVSQRRYWSQVSLSFFIKLTRYICLVIISDVTIYYKN
jgi:hypothetical protein